MLGVLGWLGVTLAFSLPDAPVSPFPPGPPLWELGPRPPPALAGIGPRLAARLRRSPEGRHHFLAVGLEREDAERAGAEVRAVVGPVFALVGDRSAIERLAGPGRRLEAPEPLRPLLDRSRVLVGADRTDDGDGFERPERGQGVRIAFYEQGLEATHRAFQGRVVALRTPAGPCPEVLACSGDPSGHGTAVASIALGADPRGVAPEAELLAALSPELDDLVEALAWFVEAAAGAPLVVNLSVGGNQGAHDGTSLEALAIDALPAVVVTSAGNEAELNIHARADLSGGPRTLRLELPGVPKGIVVELYGPADFTLEVALIDAAGTIVARSGGVLPGDAGRSAELRVGGGVLAEVDLDLERGERRHGRVGFSALDGDGLVAKGLWPALLLAGQGEVEAYADSGAEASGLPTFSRPPFSAPVAPAFGDTEVTISDLATAKTALAVGAYIGREGPSFQAPGVYGPVAPFSGRDRLGSPKPELLAPGQFIYAAQREGDDVWRSGTSFAAPHVAGAAAVLAGAKAASPAAIRAILVETAAYGRLDVATALERHLGVASGCQAFGSEGPGLLGWVLLLALVRRRCRGIPADP